MPRHRVVALVAVCLVLAIVPVSGAPGAGIDGNGQEERGVADTSGRVVAVGDIHGAFDEFVGLLRAADLVDADLRWSGGDAVLVQTGDFTDRGAGVRQVMDLLIRLQREAVAAGGEVRVALGNHEVMNLIGEVRDVTPEIMATFGDADSAATRDRGFGEFEDRVLRREDVWRRISPAQRRAVKNNWIAKHPLGYVEYLRSLGPDGEYGKWLRSLPFAVIVQDVLFLHAGITPELAEWGVAGLNGRVAAEVDAFDAYRRWLLDKERITSFANLSELLRGAAGETGGLEWLDEREEPLANPPSLRTDLATAGDDRERFQSFFYLDDWFLNTAEGPLWYRGYATWEETEGVALAAELVAALGVRAIVVGHTPQRDGIRPRFGGRVFLIDTGMLSEVYGGAAMALEIVGGEFAVIRADGGRVALPPPPPLATAPAGEVGGRR